MDDRQFASCLEMQLSKRYSVFVSSTYTDLIPEREVAFQAIMEADCFPLGMENFVAVDDDQFEFIKRVIDDADYYVLIVGGRYGSIASDGLSYTEKEYDYAVSKGIKVIALIHRNPSALPAMKVDSDKATAKKLDQFREKAKNGKMVAFWEEKANIHGLLAGSLNKTIKLFPARGWIRGDAAASEEILRELNDLRKENSELREQVEKFRPTGIEELQIASLDNKHTVTVEWLDLSGGEIIKANIERTWREYFSMISPHLESSPTEGAVSRQFGSFLARGKYEAELNKQSLATLRIQFIALGLITAQSGPLMGLDIYWSLTDRGRALMMQERIIRG